MNSTSLKTDKDSVFHFLKKLNGDVQATVAEMKSDFEKNPNSQNVKDRFLVNKSNNKQTNCLS